MNPVVARRSALKMWLLTLGGIPLVVIATDILTRRRVSNWLRELVFRPDDTQLFEPRDTIFAWLTLVIGGIFVVWGLRELFFPSKVVSTQLGGLALDIAGPFQRPVLIPWSDIVDIGSEKVEDEGDLLPLLVIDLRDRGKMPTHPWGARWLTANRLGVLADDWQEPPQEVAAAIVDYAVESVRAQVQGEAD